MAKAQWRTLVMGMVFGIIWMSSQAFMPAVIGRAIDRGVAAKDPDALLLWGGVMLLIGVVQAVAGIMRHRYAVTNWLIAAYRTVQLVGRQAVHLGGTLPRRVSTGEVIAIGTSDLSHLGQVMDVTARFAGAIVSFLLVSVIPAVDLDDPRPGRADRGARADARRRPAAAAAAGPKRPPASPDGAPLQHRLRHRRRAAGAARDRW